MIIENPTRDRFETAMFVLLQLRIETTRRPRIASSSRAVKGSAHGRFHQSFAGRHEALNMSYTRAAFEGVVRRLGTTVENMLADRARTGTWLRRFPTLAEVTVETIA